MIVSFSRLFSFGNLLVILILVVMFMSVECEGQSYKKIYVSNSFYIKDCSVPSSNYRVVAYSHINFESNPDGAWISIDGTDQKHQTPSCLPIKKKAELKITLTLPDKSVSENIKINDLTIKIRYDFGIKKWEVD